MEYGFTYLFSAKKTAFVAYSWPDVFQKAFTDSRQILSSFRWVKADLLLVQKTGTSSIEVVEEWNTGSLEPGMEGYPL